MSVYNPENVAILAAGIITTILIITQIVLLLDKRRI